ncbi:hypothetical protein BURKHO8Y_10071 [Burkholderia sp. 8Y]|nr:hypothetical protein BURKHO8Y_10071 [Burkholderia sp. 8Y]
MDAWRNGAAGKGGGFAASLSTYGNQIVGQYAGKRRYPLGLQTLFTGERLHRMSLKRPGQSVMRLLLPTNESLHTSIAAGIGRSVNPTSRLSIDSCQDHIKRQMKRSVA